MQQMIQATGYTANKAREYLVAEENDKTNTILSYHTNRIKTNQ